MPRGRRDRDRVRASLWFDGFRPISRDAFVRPAWPAAWAEARARQYAGLCIRGKLLEATPDFYTGYQDALDREAKQLASWIRERTKRIPSDADRVFAERLRVGGRVARLIGHDPRLPPELWGNRTGLQALRQAYVEFERCRCRRTVSTVVPTNPYTAAFARTTQ